MGRWRYAVVSAGVVVLLVLTLAAAALQSPLLPPRRLVSVSVAGYYGGADAALVFRVDDFVVCSKFHDRLPDSILYPTEWFRNYEWQLINYTTTRYPWLRITAGVITYCGGNCSGAWRLYESLVRLYGWEMASHSRYHIRPPRDPGDYLGSLRDIEGNITGYRPLTYIEPYGDAGEEEVEALYSHGVRVISTMEIEVPTRPEPPRDSPLMLGFTVRVADGVPWRSWLDSALKIALADGGVVVVYTHATSYDWMSPSDLLSAVDYIASAVEGKSVWVTTEGELYSYLEVSSAVKVDARVGGDTIIIDVKGNPEAGLWRVPVTIVVRGSGLSVGEVLAGGRSLPSLDAPRILSRPQEGYWVESDRVIVNVYPPANVTIFLSHPEGVSLAPHSLVSGVRTTDRARLAAYILWLPFAVIAVTAYREGRLSQLVSQRGEEKFRDRVSRARYVVLIPARNSASTVGEALSSALSQTVKPVAVAVLDDASGDGTLERALGVVEDLGGRLSGAYMEGDFEALDYSLPSGTHVLLARFHGHTGKPGMINRALKGPLSRFNFDYILILDSDTVLESSYAEKLLYNMLSGPRYSATNGVLLLWKPDKPGRIARALAGVFRNIGVLTLTLTVRVVESAAGALGGLNGAALMLERRFLESIGGLPEATTAEDAELTWTAHLHGYRVGVTPTAIAYTVDPGSLRDLLAKYLRIARGTLYSLLRLAPRLAARGRILQLASTLYNSLGGLPITISLAHLALLALLAGFGVHLQDTAMRLALLLPYTPLSLGVMPILRSPLAYLAVAYLAALVEELLILIGVYIVYRDSRIRGAIRSSLAYLPLFPVILWLSASSVAAAIPLAIYQYITGRAESKW